MITWLCQSGCMVFAWRSRGVRVLGASHKPVCNEAFRPMPLLADVVKDGAKGQETPCLPRCTRAPSMNNKASKPICKVSRKAATV